MKTCKQNTIPSHPAGTRKWTYKPPLSCQKKKKKKKKKKVIEIRVAGFSNTDIWMSETVYSNAACYSQVDLIPFF